MGLKAIVALLMVGLASPERAVAMDPATVDLESVSRLRILFGHQSVGMNILEGLEVLAREHGVSLRIVQATSAAGAPQGTLTHVFVEANGNPLQKLESFEAAFGPASGSAPDIALVKFCFIDFSSGTDSHWLFTRYRETISRLQRAHPRTVFVHVTAPLTTAEQGFKDYVKRLVGRPTSSAVNARREQFNELMRTAYGGREPLFDLARLEATAPNGRLEMGRWNGKDVPALVPAYTDDGGHLNERGRRRAASALLSVLASAASRP